MDAPSSPRSTESADVLEVTLNAIDTVSDDGADRSDVEVVDRLGILANDVRLAVVLALLDRPDEPLTYADLRDHAAVETDNFNYHLGRLNGTFVQRTDEGYRLTPAGRRSGMAVVRGVFGRHPVVEQTMADGEAVHIAFPVGQISVRASLDESLDLVGVSLERSRRHW